MSDEQAPSDPRFAGRRSSEGTGVEDFGERRRPIAAVIVLFAVLEGAASLLVAAAFGFDFQAAHFGSLLDRGAR